MGWKRIKSRLRRKKNCAYSSPDSIVCIKGWHVPTCGNLRQPTLRGSRLRLRLSPSCASGFAFRLHGVVHNTPSPMAGLLHIEIAGVVRRVMRVMRMLSALFPQLLLHIRASQGGAKRDGCYALVDGGARPSLTAFREG